MAIAVFSDRYHGQLGLYPLDKRRSHADPTSMVRNLQNFNRIICKLHADVLCFHAPVSISCKYRVKDAVSQVEHQTPVIKIRLCLCTQYGFLKGTPLRGKGVPFKFGYLLT